MLAEDNNKGVSGIGLCSPKKKCIHRENYDKQWMISGGNSFSNRHAENPWGNPVLEIYCHGLSWWILLDSPPVN
jgi:hypothetical protein